MGAPSKAPGGGAHRRARGEADQTAERTHGRQEVWEAGGWVWRTAKSPVPLLCAFMADGAIRAQP
eukprot:scaffold7515_cov95-Isochrysis_galbana.AAC.1